VSCVSPKNLARASILVAALVASLPTQASDVEQRGLSAATFLGDPGRVYVPGELVVKFAPAASRAAAQAALASGGNPSFGSNSLDALAAAHGVRRARRAFRGYDQAPGKAAADRARALRGAHPARASRAPRGLLPPDLENVFTLEVAAGANLSALAAAFAADPDVVYAEPNYLYSALAETLPPVALIPDDRFVSQDGVTWSEGAWAQDFPDLYGLRNSQAIEAWNDFDTNGDGDFGAGETRPGDGVVVAIVDSGVDVAHPDLAGRIWVNPGEIPGNGIDDDANGFIDDLNGWDFVGADAITNDGRGHGTHVAGTVSAAADNSEGVAGLAPWSQLMAVRGLNSAGQGTATDLANALIYAVDNGADILQNSWGGASQAAVIVDAFAYAYAAGVLSIAAAGNASGDVSAFSPAGIDTVMAVAAVDHEDVRAGFSNFGLGIDLSAPGVAVLSLNAHGGANGIASQVPERVVETDYLWLNGTSMACPHVAGAAAALMSAHPGESIDDLRGRLMAGAVPIDAANPGFATLLGSGRLDLLASLRAEPGPVFQLVGIDADPLLPGAEAELDLSVRNFWKQAPGVMGTLVSLQPDVSVTHAQASFGYIDQGEISSSGPPFVIELSDQVQFGSELQLELLLRDANGVEAVIPIELQVTYFQPVGKPGIPVIDTLPLNARAADFDDDGDLDLVYVQFQEFGVYRNTRGRFAEVTKEVGVAEHGSLGRFVGLFFDLTPGIYPDLFVGGNPTAGNFAYENEGWFSFFDDVSATAGLAPDLDLITAIALDHDGNGTVDLFGGDEQPTLLSNDGNGGLADVALGSGLMDFVPFIGQAVAFDYDQDGDQDIFGVSDGSHTRVFQNDGSGFFSDVTAGSGLQHPLGRGYGIAVGDVDGDGWVDVLLTGIGAPTGAQHQALFRNLGNGQFLDVTASSGDLDGDPSGFLWGTAFFDLDNDGDLDLYLNTEGGGDLRNELFENDGNGVFSLITDQAFPRAALPRSTATAIFDLDQDGDLDIFAPTAAVAGGGNGALFENLIASGNWLMLDLSPASGRDVWGARVVVTTAGVSRTREVVDSPLAPNPVHIGLAGATRADRVEIYWPDGSMQSFENLHANLIVEVVQGEDPCATGLDADGDGISNICDFANDAPALAPAAQAVLVGLLGLGGWIASRRRAAA